MELYQLKGFAAVAAEGHLTRAADKLHVSQPALSAQIKALEDEWEVELFERLPGGMSLTPVGRKLLAAVHDILSAVQALQAQARSIRGELAGHVRLGTVADPTFVRLPELLALTRERCPLIEVEVHHEVTGAAFAKVRDGEIDVSFYYGDRTHPDVASLALVDFAFCVVGPAAWRERLEGRDIALLAELPWILTPPISTHRALSDRLLGRLGIQPATVVEADNENVIRSLVVAGLGVALMREDVAHELQGAGEIAVWDGQTLPTTLQLIWQRAHGDGPAIAAMRDLAREVWPRPSTADSSNGAGQGRTAGASTGRPAARAAR